MELSSVNTGCVSGAGVPLEFATSKPDDSTCDSVSVGVRLWTYAAVWRSAETKASRASFLAAVSGHPALRRRRDRILKRRLQRRKRRDGHRQVGKQRIVFEADNHQDREAVQVIVGKVAKVSATRMFFFHFTPLFPHPKMIRRAKLPGKPCTPGKLAELPLEINKNLSMDGKIKFLLMDKIRDFLIGL